MSQEYSRRAPHRGGNLLLMNGAFACHRGNSSDFRAISSGIFRMRPATCNKRSASFRNGKRPRRVFRAGPAASNSKGTRRLLFARQKCVKSRVNNNWPARSQLAERSALAALLSFASRKRRVNHILQYVCFMLERPRINLRISVLYKTRRYPLVSRVDCWFSFINRPCERLREKVGFSEPSAFVCNAYRQLNRAS